MAKFDFLGYKIEIEEYADETVKGVMARMVQFPSCFVIDDDFDSAIAELYNVFADWLAIAKERGIEVPPPAQSEEQEELEYSGRFTTRTSKGLHRELAEEAQRQGVSLNTYVVEVLSRYAGQTEKSRNRLAFM